MIKNVVFDVSGVLLKFNFLGFLDVFNWTPKVKQQISEILFKSEQGENYMEGKISNATFCKALLSSYPKHKDEIKQVFKKELFEQITVPDYNTFELLKELKSSDYNVYIFSNMDRKQSVYFRNLFNIDEHINGAVYSYEFDSRGPEEDSFKKPDPRIFKAFLAKFGINPEETLYIDDGKKNIATAKTLGFNTVVFKSSDTTIPQIKSYLQGNSSEVKPLRYVNDSQVGPEKL